MSKVFEIWRKFIKEQEAQISEGEFAHGSTGVPYSHLRQAIDVYTALEQQLSEAQGALAAQDKMQNEQLDKWRERLSISEHIVASSDIVDDLCEYLGAEIERLKEIEQMVIDSKHGNYLKEFEKRKIELLAERDNWVQQSKISLASAGRANKLLAQCRDVMENLKEKSRLFRLSWLNKKSGIGIRHGNLEKAEAEAQQLLDQLPKPEGDDGKQI